MQETRRSTEHHTADILDDSGDVGDLVEEIKLALVEIFSGT